MLVKKDWYNWHWDIWSPFLCVGMAEPKDFHLGVSIIAGQALMNYVEYLEINFSVGLGWSIIHLGVRLPH